MAKSKIKKFFKGIKEAKNSYQFWFLFPTLVLFTILIFFMWNNSIFVADNINKAFDFDVEEVRETPIEFDRETFEGLNIVR